MTLKVNGKDNADLYSAFIVIHPNGSQVWITLFYWPLSCQHSLDSATTD